MTSPRRFTSQKDRTPEFMSLLHTLRTTASAGLAAAEAEAADIEHAWSEKYKRSDGVPCIRRVAGVKCAHRDQACRLPGADHDSLWISKADGSLLYVTQPYQIGNDNIHAISAICSALGLDAYIHGASWHYPARTVLIEIRKTKRQKGDTANA